MSKDIFLTAARHEKCTEWILKKFLPLTSSSRFTFMPQILRIHVHDISQGRFVALRRSNESDWLAHIKYFLCGSNGDSANNTECYSFSKRVEGQSSSIFTTPWELFTTITSFGMFEWNYYVHTRSKKIILNLPIYRYKTTIIRVLEYMQLVANKCTTMGGFHS